jgi:hypothetical protein
VIVDAILALCSAVVDFIVGLLPDDDLELPGVSTLTAWIGEYTGPADRFLPMSEAMTALEMMLSVYLPVALTYTVTKWIYRHLPVLGKG